MDNGQVVKMHPINFENFVRIMQVNVEPSDEGEVEDAKRLMFDSLLSIVESVDDITDRGMVKQWLEKVPANWIRNLSKSIEETTDWGPSFESEQICKDCKKKMTIVAPLNPLAFFT